MDEPALYTVNGRLYVNYTSALYTTLSYEGGDMVLYMIDTDQLPVHAHRETKLHDEDVPVVVDWVGINSNTYAAYKRRCERRNIKLIDHSHYRIISRMLRDLESILATQSELESEPQFDSTVFELLEDAIKRVKRTLRLPE